MPKTSFKRNRLKRLPPRRKQPKVPANKVNSSLQSVLIANAVATWTWDIRSNRVFADKGMARIFGVSPRRAAGGPIEHYVNAIHPDDRKSVQDAIATALKGPSDRYEIVYRVVRPNGEISWLDARGIVQRDSRGRPVQFPGVVLDITSRRAAEERAHELDFRLKQQSRIFDITLSSISDFAYIFNPNGKFAFVNQALLDLWGLKLEDAVGKDFHELNYPKALAERLQRQIQQVFDTKKGLVDETPYTSPTGAGGYYEYIFCPVFDSEGKVEVVAGSTRDITERKRIEEELRKSHERYRQLAENLETKVRVRTAELESRNTEAILQSDRLRDLWNRLMTMQDEERRRIARDMHDSAGQKISALSISLSRIMRKIGPNDSMLLALAKEAREFADDLGQEIRTTSYLLHPPMLDETGLPAALGWYVDGLKQRSTLDIELTIEERLERPTPEIELAVFRIVQECLTNIHRHSQSKSANIRIARENSDLVVEVRDYGQGIAPDRLAAIRDKGAGVGLRGMRERVRPFGGEVRIDSQLGTGTRVVVNIPEKV
jgi:PAS domain S-box-containing protein